MRKGFTGVLLGMLAAVATMPASAVPETNGGDFVLSSPDVRSGGPFVKTAVSNTFGCTGDNRSPLLQWRGAPAGTKSFVVTMFDPDEHGSPSGWWHWIVYDIPGGSNHLSRNAGSERNGARSGGALQGRNDEGKRAYGGPCPDGGDPPHHYVVTIYALKVAKLPVRPGASGANVTYTARDYTLGSATIVALHGRGGIQ